MFAYALYSIGQDKCALSDIGKGRLHPITYE